MQPPSGPPARPSKAFVDCVSLSFANLHRIIAINIIMRAAYDFSIKPCNPLPRSQRGSFRHSRALQIKGLCRRGRAEDSGADAEGFRPDSSNQLPLVAGVCNAYLLIKCRMCVKSCPPQACAAFPLVSPWHAPAGGAIVALPKWNQWIVMQR